MKTCTLHVESLSSALFLEQQKKIKINNVDDKKLQIRRYRILDNV